MRCHLVPLLVAACGAWALAVAAVTSTEGAEPRAGWSGVFPDLNGYEKTFLAPVVEKGEKPVVYRQTARYEWTGGAIKRLEATAARDPAFKERFESEALRKQKPPPMPVKVGKRTAWVWLLAKEGEGGIDKPFARLVVLLGEDRALILDAKGAGPWESLTEVVVRFDLDRIDSALTGPPK